ncbi:hypothetical protein J6590_053394 [Homalodisca vitripennis]|nr:hypothetical protein J6590_053394 [Homalodisca vitripennis]
MKANKEAEEGNKKKRVRRRLLKRKLEVNDEQEYCPGGAFREQVRYYNMRRRQPMLQIGQQVLYRRHDLSDASKSFAAKLTLRFEGPYTIISTEGKIYSNLSRIAVDS